MQADEIPFARSKQLFSYWGRWLPSHIGITNLLRSFTGWQPAGQQDQSFRESTPDELARFAAAFESAG